jgi:S-adenosylmethionine decarboxylase
VTILAESHISIHTWPERGYAAIDVFMCGQCDPLLTLPVLEESFRPARLETHLVQRGLIPAALFQSVA